MSGSLSKLFSLSAFFEKVGNYLGAWLVEFGLRIGFVGPLFKTLVFEQKCEVGITLGIILLYVDPVFHAPSNFHILRNYI